MGWVEGLVTNLVGTACHFWGWLVAACAGPIRRWLRPSDAPAPGRRPGRPQLAIQDEELQATLEQIERHPWMGGKKGAANLVHGRNAWVGAGSYDAMKAEVANLCGKELARRRQHIKAPTPFELPVAEGLNQVWSSDLVEIRAWGLPFHVGNMMDVYNGENFTVRACPLAADGPFVADLFERACEARGGAAPTVCTKTDRGTQFMSQAFEDGLRGRTRHLRIPPGCPWYNGECERGNRDLKAVLYGLISRAHRPRGGEELTALLALCEQARLMLNQEISRPSLGNVTPDEVARGVQEEVKRGNQEFIEQRREQRRQTASAGLPPWQERLQEALRVCDRSTEQIVRLLNLIKRDYARMGR